VQRAGQRSLRGGMTTPRALEVLRDIRARVDVPLVPMTYAAPVMAYGEARFCAAAAAAGASGLIVPDVPADEAGDIEAGCRAHGLDLVPLLAPTSADDRIALACAQAGGFVYLVSVAGVTGARERLSGRVAELARRVRAHTELPLLVGFGISAPEHAVAALEAGADGVVIGSKAIEVSEAGGPDALAEFVASIVTAVSPAAAS
jgi:tryptophan synthase alpha chain